MLAVSLLPAPLLCPDCCCDVGADVGCSATAGAAAEVVTRLLETAGRCCCSACCAAGDSTRADSCLWVLLARHSCADMGAWEATALLLRRDVGRIARDSLRRELKHGRMLLVLGTCVTFMASHLHAQRKWQRCGCWQQLWVIGALAWIDTAYSDIALHSNSNVASFEDQDTN